MIKNGYVVWVNDDKAKIRINRESSCGGNCAHCKGCGTSEMILDVTNDLDLSEGEIVKVFMDNKLFLRKAALGYGMLVCSMIIGGILGNILFKSELASASCSIAFLVIVLLVFRTFFKGKSLDIRVERI